ncbi:MAG: hypothetical protein ACJ74D_06530 [Gaiellaceae bacterium]
MLRRVVRRRVPVERDFVVPVARRRAVVRPPFAAAERDGARRVLLLRRVPVVLRRVLVVLRRAPVERARVVVLRRVPVVLRRVLVVLRRAPVVLRRAPVVLRRVLVVLRRVPVERDRVVPVARRRAVVRPPFAAAERDGARRVLLLRRVPVLELLARRRVPPVEREREVVLLRVPPERDRLVVLRRRPVEEATREMLFSSGCSVGSSCC